MRDHGSLEVDADDLRRFTVCSNHRAAVAQAAGDVEHDIVAPYQSRGEVVAGDVRVSAAAGLTQHVHVQIARCQQPMKRVLAKCRWR